MDLGDKICERHGPESLVYGLVTIINILRKEENGDSSTPLSRKAIIISSLKRPDEVKLLRTIYQEGFYLIGIYADQESCEDYFTKRKHLSLEQARKIIKRDAKEPFDYGQRTTDAFELSDFFIYDDGRRTNESLWRFLDIIFGHPHKSPTFDEYAMYLAYATSLRSADLSRQVGAVIATAYQDIIATGANDVPKCGGGLYSPREIPTKAFVIEDEEDGKDYRRTSKNGVGYDSNIAEKNRIIEKIISALKDKENTDNLELAKALENIDSSVIHSAIGRSPLKDITEYGRIVHAEMEALMSCARNNISCRNGTLYCTTFPCHNCAKHIIASGIKKVVYVEPYAKSKAKDFHTDSIKIGFSELSEQDNYVHFEPFIGVGPRRFIDLFSMKLGSGREIKRQNDSTGIALNAWEDTPKDLRIQMYPTTYIEKELEYTSKLEQISDEFRRMMENEK